MAVGLSDVELTAPSPVYDVDDLVKTNMGEGNLLDAHAHFHQRAQYAVSDEIVQSNWAAPVLSQDQVPLFSFQIFTYTYMQTYPRYRQTDTHTLRQTKIQTYIHT